IKGRHLEMLIYLLKHKKTLGVMIIKGRHLEMLIYLLKHKKTTYKQLAQHFEVSVKTIERDINSLSSMGIPVYCTQGVGGGVSLDETYKFSTSFFTATDIHQIIFALKIMDSLSYKSQKNEIINKLCLLAPDLSTMFASDADHYLSIDLLTDKVDISNEIYEKIDYCLDNELLVLINNSIKAAPIGYVLKTDGLYLFCFTDTYQMIKCHDIKNIITTTLVFQRNFISYEEYKKINS
ncbi:MAG: HTH domain-containing protein, partial [Bacilli bacterium]